MLDALTGLDPDRRRIHVQVLIDGSILGLEFDRGVAGDLGDGSVDHRHAFPFIIFGRRRADVLALMTSTRWTQRHRPRALFAIVVTLFEGIVVGAAALAAAGALVAAVAVDLRVHMRVAAGIEFYGEYDVWQIDEPVALAPATAAVGIKIARRIVGKSRIYRRRGRGGCACWGWRRAGVGSWRGSRRWSHDRRRCGPGSRPSSRPSSWDHIANDGYHGQTSAARCRRGGGRAA